MPAILLFLRGMVSSATLRPLIANILVMLGMTAVSYAGFGALISYAMSHVASNYGGLPADALAVLAVAKVPNAINVILSAFTARAAFMGLTQAGVLKRVLWRPGQQGTLF